MIGLATSRAVEGGRFDQRLQSGLIGHWIGGGNGNIWFDRSGKDNHGILTNFASTDNPWVLSRDGCRNALRMPGVDEYVNVPSTTYTSNGLTWSCWINLLAAGSYPMVMTWYGNGNYWELRHETGSRVPGVYWGGATITSSFAATLGEWYHLAITLTPSGTLTLYHNGKSQGQTSATYTEPTGMYFGSRYLPSLYANAILDDVRVYTRSLSSGEIATLASPSFMPIVATPRWLAKLNAGGGGSFKPYWVRPKSQVIGGGNR